MYTGIRPSGTVHFHLLPAHLCQQRFQFYMNAYLPEDIAVIQAEEVPERFHSRLNAKGKTYCYRVLNSETALPVFPEWYWPCAPVSASPDILFLHIEV